MHIVTIIMNIIIIFILILIIITIPTILQQKQYRIVWIIAIFISRLYHQHTSASFIFSLFFSNHIIVIFIIFFINIFSRSAFAYISVVFLLLKNICCFYIFFGKQDFQKQQRQPCEQEEQQNDKYQQKNNYSENNKTFNNKIKLKQQQ